MRSEFEDYNHDRKNIDPEQLTRNDMVRKNSAEAAIQFVEAQIVQTPDVIASQAIELGVSLLYYQHEKAMALRYLNQEAGNTELEEHYREEMARLTMLIVDASRGMYTSIREELVNYAASREAIPIQHPMLQAANKKLIDNTRTMAMVLPDQAGPFTKNDTSYTDPQFNPELAPETEA